MPMMGGGYQRYSGFNSFPHKSISPWGEGILVLSALDDLLYYLTPSEPLYSYYYDLGGFGNSYGGYGGNYSSRIWNPWRASPRFTRWPSYQSNSGLGFFAGLTLGGLFGGNGGRRKR